MHCSVYEIEINKHLLAQNCFYPPVKLIRLLFICNSISQSNGTLAFESSGSLAELQTLSDIGPTRLCPSEDIWLHHYQTI